MTEPVEYFNRLLKAADRANYAAFARWEYARSRWPRSRAEKSHVRGRRRANPHAERIAYLARRELFYVCENRARRIDKK